MSLLIKKDQEKKDFGAASLAPIHHLLNSHDNWNPKWYPVKANKNVNKGKYQNIDDNKEMFDWLVKNAGKRMEGEKLRALHHLFDTKMNKPMKNAVARICQKNKIFAGSSSVFYQVASVAGQHIQGSGKYMSDIHLENWG